MNKKDLIKANESNIFPGTYGEAEYSVQVEYKLSCFDHKKRMCTWIFEDLAG